MNRKEKDCIIIQAKSWSSLELVLIFWRDKSHEFWTCILDMSSMQILMHFWLLYGSLKTMKSLENFLNWFFRSIIDFHFYIPGYWTRFICIWLFNCWSTFLTYLCPNYIVFDYYCSYFTVTIEILTVNIIIGVSNTKSYFHFN